MIIIKRKTLKGAQNIKGIKFLSFKTEIFHFLKNLPVKFGCCGNIKFNDHMKLFLDKSPDVSRRFLKYEKKLFRFKVSVGIILPSPRSRSFSEVTETGIQHNKQFHCCLKKEYKQSLCSIFFLSVVTPVVHEYPSIQEPQQENGLPSSGYYAV